MQQSSVTALICAFARAYHAKINKVKIFDDSCAIDLLTEEEFRLISLNFANGIQYFNPAFSGDETTALRWIVDNQLSPSPLGRAAYSEKMLQNAVRIGARQYLIFAAGFDTFAYRQPEWADKLQIFEIDHPATSQDKQLRAQSLSQNCIDNCHYIAV